MSNQANTNLACGDPIRGIGYTLLDNGESVCLMFPHVPGAREPRLCDGGVQITSDGGELFFAEVGDRALRAAGAGHLFVVGIDSLSRPVFESSVRVLN